MTIARIEWVDLYTRLERGKKRWKRGEHLSIIGPTGSGKTYLGLHLLPMRSYVAVLENKMADDTITRYAKENDYEIIKEWPPSSWRDRCIVWPSYKQPGDEYKQRRVFVAAIGTIFSERIWTVFIDEVSYFTHTLKMEPYLKALWEQGRSIKISFMAATQRPKAVPMHMYDQPTHLFFFRFRDENDLKRIGGIGYLDRKEIQQEVAHLEKHEFLYIHIPSGYMAISRVIRE